MTNLLNPRRTAHQCLCLLLATTMAFTPVMAIAQQPATPIKPVDVSPPQGVNVADGDTTLLASSATSPQPVELNYIVPNSCVLLALRPAQLLSSPIAELYPTEVFQAAGLQHTGLDPLAAEHVILSVAPTIGGPPSYSVFARFNKPVELKPSALTEHTAAAEIAGAKYFQSNDPMLPSIAPVDGQALLVAPDYFLRNLVQAKQAQTAPAVNTFAAAFAAADQGDDLLLMVDIQPLRAIIGLATSQAPIPPELTSAKRLPNLIRFIELRANFSRPAASSLIITANNEADAEQIITISNEMKQLVAAKWAVEAQKLLADEDPVQQAAGRYSLRMSRLMDERIELQREGDRLVVFRDNINDQGSNPMVTTATIGVLVALLLPAVQAAREAARRNASINNLRNIMLASLNYEATHRKYPPHANYDDAGKPLLSWRVHILPFIEQQALYEKFHLSEPWDSPHNIQLVAEMPELYLDPSSRVARTEGKTHYLAIVGDTHLFPASAEGRKMAEITDGTSNTIAFVQAGDAAAVSWTKPEDWTPDESNLMKPFDRLHPGGFSVAFADGSIHFLGYDIDRNVFKALLTYAGDEPVDPNAY